MLNEALCTLLWDRVIPKQVKIFLWTTDLDSINTQSIPQYVLCAVKMSSSHLSRCEFARKVQNFFGQMFGLQGCKPHGRILWLAKILSRCWLKDKDRVLCMNLARAIPWLVYCLYLETPT